MIVRGSGSYDEMKNEELASAEEIYARLGTKIEDFN